MSTSGSTNFSLNSRQIIDEALRLLGNLQEGDSPSTARASEALNALNMMLKTWGASGRLWLMTEGSLTLIAGQAAYSLAVGIRRVTSVRRLTAGLETPLEPRSRQQYFDLPNKTSTGTPNSYYFDPQRSARTLYVWPTAETLVAANTTLPYTYVRFIEDCDSLDNDPDAPTEWLETIVYNLAVRLGPRYGAIDNKEFGEIKAHALGLYDLLPTLDQEDTSFFLSPSDHY